MIKFKKNSNLPTSFSRRRHDQTAKSGSLRQSVSYLIQLLIQLSFCVLIVVGMNSQAFGQTPEGKIALLELGVGARALGMGGAYVSLGGDADSLLYNPAGLAFMNRSQLSGYASRPFEAFHHVAMGYAVPNLGVSVMQMGLNSVMETNEFGNPTGRTLDYTSRSAIGGFGYEIFPGAAFGAQVKLYSEESGPVTGFGWAVDPALLYRTDFLSIGLIWRNAISDDIQYDNDYEEAWASDLTIGGSWKLSIEKQVYMLLAADVSGVMQNDIAVQVGGEAWLGQFGIRLGWDRGLITAGASVLYRNLQIHWAYAFHDTLPQTLRLSASMDF